jgi:hypothetical protein
MEHSGNNWLDLDYENLRPPKSLICKKPHTLEFTYVKDKPVFRNLYYGFPIPDDLKAKTEEFNVYIKEEIAAGRLVPNLPEYWSFRDSFRLGEAAAFKKVDMVRDIVDIAPWTEKMKSFNLSQKATNLILNGNIYVSGRDKNGYPNIIYYIKGVESTEENINAIREATIFVMSVVKKYMLLPYHAEMYNLFVDIDNMGLWGFPKKL